jgi:hypothetical protein
MKKYLLAFNIICTLTSMNAFAIEKGLYATSYGTSSGAQSAMNSIYIFFYSTVFSAPADEIDQNKNIVKSGETSRDIVEEVFMFSSVAPGITLGITLSPWAITAAKTDADEAKASAYYKAEDINAELEQYEKNGEISATFRGMIESMQSFASKHGQVISDDKVIEAFATAVL